MLFTNEIYLKIGKKDLLSYSKILYLLERYKFYWEYTNEKNFLFLYQQTLKKELEFHNYINSKYLKEYQYDNYFIDLQNERIILNKCEVKKND